MNQRDLDGYYIQSLEEEIIKYLSLKKKIDIRKSMDIYYKSKLSVMIECQQYGIENMDYKYLVEDLIENEPELFSKKSE